jgi:type I pantothenate kinase
MPMEDALERAQEIWRTINLPNLLENIISTKSRATLVLQKGVKHRVERVLLRKI